MARIGTLLDKLYKIKLEKEQCEAVLLKIKARYNACERDVFNSFRNEEIHDAGGKVAKGSISTSKYPTLKDYGKLERFVHKEDALDMFQKRLSVSAWRDRLETRNNRPIPGVTTFETTRLNLRKR